MGAKYGTKWGGKAFKVNANDVKLNGTEGLSFAFHIRNLDPSSFGPPVAEFAVFILSNVSSPPLAVTFSRKWNHSNAHQEPIIFYRPC